MKKEQGYFIEEGRLNVGVGEGTGAGLSLGADLGAVSGARVETDLGLDSGADLGSYQGAVLGARAETDLGLDLGEAADLGSYSGLDSGVDLGSYQGAVSEVEADVGSDSEAVSKTCRSARQNQDQAVKVLPLLAIDGGGTKTIAVITDEQGHILGTGKGGTSNYHVAGEEHTIETLKKVIVEAIYRYKKRAALKDESEVAFKLGVFALAGFDTNKDKTNIERLVNLAIADSHVQFQAVVVENDALSALLGATQQQPGVLLISGTGSIAFAHDGTGHYFRSGGWGHLLGDEGGGYWIGKKAINAILKMHDGRGPSTMLAPLVLQHLQLETHEHLYNWVYGPDSSIDKIAALSTLVEQAHQEGDQVSKTILDDAVTNLYQLINGVSLKSKITNHSFKLLFLGGILQNNEYIKNELMRLVTKEMPNVEILPNHQKPINLIIQRGLMWDRGGSSR